MIYLKDIINNDPEEIRYFSEDYADFAAAIEKHFQNKRTKLERRRQWNEAWEKAAEQAKKNFHENVRRRLEANEQIRKSNSLKEKFARASKDAINSVKNASIKAGRDAKAGLLRGMRRGALSLSESADKLSKSLLRIRH